MLILILCVILFLCGTIFGIGMSILVNTYQKYYFNCYKCQDTGKVEWLDYLGKQSYICDCKTGKSIINSK